MWFTTRVRIADRVVNHKIRGAASWKKSIVENEWKNLSVLRTVGHVVRK